MRSMNPSCGCSLNHNNFFMIAHYAKDFLKLAYLISITNFIIQMISILFYHWRKRLHTLNVEHVLELWSQEMDSSPLSSLLPRPSECLAPGIAWDLWEKIIRDTPHTISLLLLFSPSLPISSSLFQVNKHFRNGEDGIFQL